MGFIKSIAFKLLTTFAVWFIVFSVHAQTDRGYEYEMLRGARTASLNFKLAPDKGCEFNPEIIEDTKEGIERIGRTGLNVMTHLDESFIPDISLLILLETTRSEVDMKGGLCNMFVKFEAFHQTIGALRYSGAQPILRVLVQRSIRYGSAPSKSIPEAVRTNALKAMNDFELAYILANK